MKVAVLGTGNMGRALIAGLKKAYGEKVSIIAFDQIEKSLSGLDVQVLQPHDWFANNNTPDVVIIAVKPSEIGTALLAFSSVNETEKLKPLWISIAAGVNITSLQSHFPLGARICRVMPNTPALVGESMSACALNTFCQKEDQHTVETVFNAVGKSVIVPEKQMNAVTGLSGSGPAYVYLFIEALIEGGVTAGLPYATARECALQTVFGAAKMVSETGENTNALKIKVMSPAGTTANGLLALESHGFKHAVISAVVDATKRSEQLGA
jgi:pyrroline-5-carboxylate reductase